MSVYERASACAIAITSLCEHSNENNMHSIKKEYRSVWTPHTCYVRWSLAFLLELLLKLWSTQLLVSGECAKCFFNLHRQPSIQGVFQVIVYKQVSITALDNT